MLARMGFLSCLYKLIYANRSHDDIRLGNVYRSDSHTIGSCTAADHWIILLY